MSRGNLEGIKRVVFYKSIKNEIKSLGIDKKNVKCEMSIKTGQTCSIHIVNRDTQCDRTLRSRRVIDILLALPENSNFIEFLSPAVMQRDMHDARDTNRAFADARGMMHLLGVACDDSRRDTSERCVYTASRRDATRREKGVVCKRKRKEESARERAREREVAIG